ncbi:MAG: hypothetical protein ACF8XB_20475 [Planctomycetota bacterium JB042]
MSDENAGDRAEPGRILRALQETAKAELPEFGDDAAPSNPLEQELGAPRAVPPPRTGPTSREPTLEVERDGEHVRRIVAVCSCGRKIDIQCDYDAAAATHDGTAAAPDGGAPT